MPQTQDRRKQPVTDELDRELELESERELMEGVGFVQTASQPAEEQHAQTPDTENDDELER